MIAVCSNRINDIEEKYYADGEDAYAMNRDLSSVAELVRREKHQSFESIPDFLKEAKDEGEVGDNKATDTTASDQQAVQVVVSDEETDDDKTETSSKTE